ncbi:MAG TPA: adenylosuccinate synthase [Roseiflexaceae bacterium]|nr:adenylosuccinate synthase [Roseiflexaceae bacterium]
MAIEVVVGVNWGDEGKGRMVDYLAQDADVVVRYQGGSNAGHTVVNEHGTFKLHLIPSGIFNPDVVNVLGPGMVIDLEALCSELDDLRARGVVPNIQVSDRATICFPFHRDEDVWEEERLEQAYNQPFGSTRRGIAPAYGDRAVKKGIQVGDLFDTAALTERVRQLVDWKNRIAEGVYGRQDAVSFEATMAWLERFGGQVRHLITDTSALLEEAARQDKKILFEAQLGALRDVYFGIYPYTSSSCALAAFAPIGGGLFGHPPSRVVGVMKAFSTCVGEGPFVTEINDSAVAGSLREVALEYGAATGRPRRIGYFDALASRYGATVQSATELALTKLDSLTGFGPLLICTHYELDGRRLDSFPLVSQLERCRPVYEELPGWSEDISGVRRFEDLPETARSYVLRIEELIGFRIRYVSVGPERGCLMDRGVK